LDEWSRRKKGVWVFENESRAKGVKEVEQHPEWAWAPQGSPESPGQFLEGHLTLFACDDLLARARKTVAQHHLELQG